MLMWHPHVSFIVKDSDDWLQLMLESYSIEINETCNQAWAKLGLTRRRQFRRCYFRGLVHYEGRYWGPMDQAVKNLSDYMDKQIMDILDPELQRKLRSVT